MQSPPSLYTRFIDLQAFLAFYLASWGAAKGEVWEEISNGPMEDATALAMVHRILAGTRTFTEEELRHMAIVSG